MKTFSKIFLALGFFAIVSCGDEKKEEGEKIVVGKDYSTETTISEDENNAVDTTSTNGTSVDDASGSEEVVELELTGNDQMQFNKNELRVEAGQTVRLTLSHVGEMPENVMGHNFVLLKKGTDINQFGQAAAGAKENDFVPAGSDKVIAHTEIIGGGESVTIEFEAPEEGTYDFICSFPGHYAVMQGKFIVE